MREDMEEVRRLIIQYGFYKWEEGYATAGRWDGISDYTAEDYNKMCNKILNDIEEIIE